VDTFLLTNLVSELISTIPWSEACVLNAPVDAGDDDIAEAEVGAEAQEDTILDQDPVPDHRHALQGNFSTFFNEIPC
jgi:hypothetical protein